MMNNLQKLQVCTGIATPIATTLYIYFGVISPIMKFVDYSPWQWSDYQEGGVLLLIIFMCSVIVACGAYSSAKGSFMGLALLCTSGLVVIVSLGFWGFFVFIWQGIHHGMLVYSPVILSGITIWIALSTKLITLSAKSRD